MATVESRLDAVTELVKRGEIHELPKERRSLMNCFVDCLDLILAWHATQMGEEIWCSKCGGLQPPKHKCKP